MRDFAPPIDQHADLPTDLPREFRQLSREIVVEANVCVEATAKQAFELFDLAGLEAFGVSVDLDGELLRTRDEGRLRG